MGAKLIKKCFFIFLSFMFKIQYFLNLKTFFSKLYSFDLFFAFNSKNIANIFQNCESIDLKFCFLCNIDYKIIDISNNYIFYNY